MKRWYVLIVSTLAFGAGCGVLSQATPLAEPAPTVQQPTQAAPQPSPSVAVATPESETPSTQQEEPPSPTPTAPDLAAIHLELRQVATGLDQPVGVVNAGDGSGRLFVLEKAGDIRIVRGGEVLAAPFLDISQNVGSGGFEQGLLGLAFHPDYANNGYFFVDYTDRRGDTVVSRFSVSDDPDRADPASENLLLTQSQPAQNHNGGQLAFGPDGYLYIGLGDGGGGGDTYGNGQNGATLLGTLLRLDVSGGQAAIPPDNPFVGDPNVRDEIWAHGLRNPWRFSFDRATGDLYIADVGQGDFEEINFEAAGSGGGQNYGWPITEGLHCFSPARGCDSSGLTLPVAEYGHELGCSATGGYVYRGQQFAALQGVYFFGDFCSGRIWGLARAQDGSWQMVPLLQASISISSFGEDEAGEVYVLDMDGGVVDQLVAR